VLLPGLPGLFHGLDQTYLFTLVVIFYLMNVFMQIK